MARGVDGRDVFIDDRDRISFLAALERIRLDAGAVVYAYCLMNNHFHLAVKVDAVPLASIMQRILTGYAITFNGRHDRAGHLFQARYKAIHCADDRYLLGLIRYIQHNPVRAGLVERPEDWPWSSRSPESLPNIDAFDPWPTESRALTLTRPPRRELASLSAIEADVLNRTGVLRDGLHSGSRTASLCAARRLFAREAALHGYRIADVARWFGVSLSTAAYWVQ